MKITDFRNSSSISQSNFGTGQGDVGIGSVVDGLGGVPITGTAGAAGQVLYFGGTTWAPTQVVLAGTLAARPAAATTNTAWLYIVTDGVGGMYFSTGSSWLLVSSGPFDPAAYYELVVADGLTFPPDPLYNETGDDFLYGLALV